MKPPKGRHTLIPQKPISKTWVRKRGYSDWGCRKDNTGFQEMCNLDVTSLTPCPLHPGHADPPEAMCHRVASGHIIVHSLAQSTAKLLSCIYFYVVNKTSYLANRYVCSLPACERMITRTEDVIQYRNFVSILKSMNCDLFYHQFVWLIVEPLLCFCMHLIYENFLCHNFTA